MSVEQALPTSTSFPELEGKTVQSLVLPEGHEEANTSDSVDPAWEAFDALRLDSVASRTTPTPPASSVSNANDKTTDVGDDFGPFDAFQDVFKPDERTYVYDDRIEEELRPFVCVGHYGGLVFTPRAIVDADLGNQLMTKAFQLVVDHGLIADEGDTPFSNSPHPKVNVNSAEKPQPQHVNSASEEKIPHIASSPQENGEGSSSARIAQSEPTVEDDGLISKDANGFATRAVDMQSSSMGLATSNSGSGETSKVKDMTGGPLQDAVVDDSSADTTASDLAPEPHVIETDDDDDDFEPMLSFKSRKDFVWMESENRRVVLAFGNLIHAQRTEQESAERRDSEAARATAAAASERSNLSDFPVDDSNDQAASGPATEDTTQWIAQERTVIAETLRVVRHQTHKRSRRNTGITSSLPGHGADGDDLSFRGFLMPRSSKMKPEAAAEMARARVAAAAAVKAMMENSEKSADDAKPARECPSPHDPIPLNGRIRPASEPAIHLNAITSGAASSSQDRRPTVRASLPFLDDSTMLWRAEMQNAMQRSDLDSPRGNPGFPPALAENPSRKLGLKQAAKKKRVSFGSSTVYDDTTST